MQAKNAAQALYSILIPDRLEPEKVICFVGDKTIHRVPFASLMSPEGRYLIEDFELLSSPSASVFIEATEIANRRESKNERLLAFGNPSFDPKSAPELQNLPEAKVEVDQTAILYRSAMVFTEANARKSSFLENLSDAEVIHFAGHYVSNPRSPTESRFIFADEFLAASELSDKKLPNSKLAVLSACETGFESLNKSEGAIGVARIFLAMGTPVVVASSWKVDSTATQKLMTSFHRNRTTGKQSSIAALRAAQLEMLRSSEHFSPKYWSAFSVFGGLSVY